MFSLEGRSMLVTGGTRGIGREISLRLARAGATVLTNFVRDQKSADELLSIAAQEGLRIACCRADLTAPKGMDTLLEAVAGEVHGLVHCAATGVHKPFDQLTLRHYDWTMNLNVRAFFDLAQRLLPKFANSASIVAVSSQGGTRVVPAYSLIGASKGALEALARHMAVELAPRGIRVNILSPGPIATGAWDAMPGGPTRLERLGKETPLGRLASAEEVAFAAQFLCSDAARSIIGQTLTVDGGLALPLGTHEQAPC